MSENGIITDVCLFDNHMINYIFNNYFLAHLAKGNVSFCHHLASVAVVR